MAPHKTAGGNKTGVFKNAEVLIRNFVEWSRTRLFTAMLNSFNKIQVKTELILERLLYKIADFLDQVR